MGTLTSLGILCGGLGLGAAFILMAAGLQDLFRELGKLVHTFTDQPQLFYPPRPRSPRPFSASAPSGLDSRNGTISAEQYKRALDALNRVSREREETRKTLDEEPETEIHGATISIDPTGAVFDEDEDKEDSE